MRADNWKAGVALCAVTVLGAVCAAAVIPRMFSRIDTDLTRTRILLKTVQEIKSGLTPAPDIVVLGNSVTMNGVDTAIITDRLPNKPLVYNFSSTGQSLAEGYLYLQELNNNTKTVVIVVSPGNLEDDGLPSRDVYNTFYMQGYRPNSQTLSTLQSVFDRVDPNDPMGAKYPIDMFSQANYQQRFHSRWSIAQMPDTEFRKRLRKDLETTKSIKSLTYPAPYTKPISRSNFDILLPTYNKKRQSPKFSPLPTQVDLLGRIKKQLDAQSIQLLVVLAPMHPQRLSFLGPEWEESRRQWVAGKPIPGTPILDLTDALTRDDQFLDVVHPSRAAADLISDRIASFIRTEASGGSG